LNYKSTSQLENRFCVYLHISNDEDIFYVGQGTVDRAHNKSAKGRARKWYEIASKGYDVLIIYENLSKDEAVRLEKETIIKLKQQNQNLVNKSIHDGVRTLTKEMFEEYLVCDDNSKFGLIWKSDLFNKKRKGTSAGCLNKSTGYVVITHKGIQYFAHRVVMALTHGVCPKELQVNHIDGNKLNNSVSNLELVTSLENCGHAHRTGLVKYRAGEENPSAILTEEKVLAIYQRLKEGADNDTIASEFNIEFKHVSLLRNGKRWKHLYDKLGYTFKPSKKEVVNTRQQVEDTYILVNTTQLTNKAISEITGVEVSQVSRIRHKKAFPVWIDEFEKEGLLLNK
jgi:hypothetical protein